MWGKLARSMEFLALQDAVPALMERDARWGGWEIFKADAPATLSEVSIRHLKTEVVLEGMAPAIGGRLARLWGRANDRSAAAQLEAYVAASPGAPDVEAALGKLMELYSGRSALRWEAIPADAAKRLERVSALSLEKFPDSAHRSGALAARALAAYSGGNRRSEAVLKTIRASLEEALEPGADPRFFAVAAEGLVRTEAEAGNERGAAAAWAGFRERHGGNSPLVEDVRERLGVLALRAGGLPEFSAETLLGGAIGPETLRGKVVVVDFWATWCRPCVEEIEHLRRIRERHGDRVLVLGINLDRSDELSLEELRAWIATERVPGFQIHDGRSWESRLVRLFGVKEIPFSVVARPDGSVLAVNARGKDLEAAVAKAASGTPVVGDVRRDRGAGEGGP